MRQLKAFMKAKKWVCSKKCACLTINMWRCADLQNGEEFCGCWGTGNNAPSPEPTPGFEPETLYFISYGDEEWTNEYARWSVETTSETRSKKTKVIVTSNSVEEWVGQEFYIDSKAEADDGKFYKLYQLHWSRLRGIDVRVKVFAEEQVDILSLDELNN